MQEILEMLNNTEQYNQELTEKEKTEIDYLLARIKENTGVDNIIARAVYDTDDFNYWIDDDGYHIEHNPALKKRGKFKLAYAVIQMHYGHIDVEIMTNNEISEVAMQMGISNPCPFSISEMLVITCHRLCSSLLSPSEMDSMFDADKLTDAVILH